MENKASETFCGWVVMALEKPLEGIGWSHDQDTSVLVS